MKSRTSKNQNLGFTLIEALVTILITGIVASIALPSFMTWVNNKKITDIATKIEGALEEAKSTAARKNKSCSVLITETQVSSPDAGCLPKGTRNIQENQDVGISNSNLQLAGTGGSTGTTITFLAVGTVNITPETATIIVYRNDNTTNGIKKCIAVSKGMADIKNGNYTGTLPLTVDSDSTDAELEAVANQCIAT
ncbi:Tfp pilus assembly protein FimT/FimU [Altericista sp. CCNU0014]|uniref:pilus assembly FimT family protein n=1 Tax=Altericista sp. CCNU0014 TaxID=3082949 RepID=UPI003850CD18